MIRTLRRRTRFLRYNLPIHCINLVTMILPNCTPTVLIRGFLMRPFFKKCGKGLKIANGVTINNPDRIEIGDNVQIAQNNWISGVGGLKIGDNVLMGPLGVIVTSQHSFKNGKLTSGYTPGSVQIGAGCWLASHVVITEGVEIGADSLVGAGAVVTKSFPDRSKIVGVPGKNIGSPGND
ncbi:acyltransferase [Listeria booriae]|uniref:Acyltransferase n=1 Tax=Listeria booriae TaxID=1552123 RepID=A0A841ZWF5_9LIST|nr:acyltransferase [Listeria booriae]MBC1565089.1 acyltransferase [Listeria booriae]